MKIYTKTGDQGDTGLFGGGRVGKDDARVEAYGQVDELNASLGVARSSNLGPELDALCGVLQSELFTLGAVLATPAGTKAAGHLKPVAPEWAARMEADMDRFSNELPPLTTFILPGGTPGASALHLSRTVCRRAERSVMALGRSEQVPPEVVVYLNRLSDLLFTLARIANHRAQVEDVAWRP